MWTRENAAQNTCRCPCTSRHLQQHIFTAFTNGCVFPVCTFCLYCVCFLCYHALFPHYAFCNRSTCIMVTLSLSRNFGCAVSGEKKPKRCTSNTYSLLFVLPWWFIHSLTHCEYMCRLVVFSPLFAMEPGAAATPTTLCLWAKMAARHV